MKPCAILTVSFASHHQPKTIVFDTFAKAVEGVHGILESTASSVASSDWEAILHCGQEVRTADRSISFRVQEGDNALPAPHQHEDAKDDLYLYILMRNDCPGLNPGKAVAQGSHASNAMVYEARAKQSMDLNGMVAEWEEQTPQGFGNCVVLHCDYADMELAVSLTGLHGIHSNIVHDPEYPLRDGNRFHFLPVNTCAYVFGRKSVVWPHLRKHPWMP